LIFRGGFLMGGSFALDLSSKYPALSAQSIIVAANSALLS